MRGKRGGGWLGPTERWTARMLLALYAGVLVLDRTYDDGSLVIEEDAFGRRGYYIRTSTMSRRRSFAKCN